MNSIGEIMGSEMKFNFDEMRSTLSRVIQPGQTFEIRLHNITAQNRRTFNIANGYFVDVNKAAEVLEEFTKTHDYGFAYYTPNPLNPAIRARRPDHIEVVAGQDHAVGASDHDVIGRNWLLIDLDANHPAGVSSSDKEVEDTYLASKRLFSKLRPFFGDPIVVSSGNGTHMMYRVDLPVDDGGLIKRCLKQAQIDVSEFTKDVGVDQKVFNPARIWKIPGSIAKKGHELADQNRFHRPSKALYIPPEINVVGIAALEGYSASVLASEKAEPPRKQGYQPHPGHDGPKIDMREYLARHGLRIRFEKDWQNGKMFILDSCPWNPQHNNGSAWAYQSVDGALAAGCHHNSCSNNSWHELRDVCEPGWRESRKGSQQYGADCAMENRRMMMRRMFKEEYRFMMDWVRWNSKNQQN